MTDRQLVNQNDATGAVDYAQMAQASLVRAQDAWRENLASLGGLPVEWSPSADTDAEVLVSVAAQAALNTVTGGASSFRSAAATAARGAKNTFNSLEIVSTVRQEMAPRKPRSFAAFDVATPGKSARKPLESSGTADLADAVGALDGGLAGISRLPCNFNPQLVDTSLMQQIRQRLEEPTEGLNADALRQGGVAPAEVSRLFTNGDNRVKTVIEDAAPKATAPLFHQQCKI